MTLGVKVSAKAELEQTILHKQEGYERKEIVDFKKN